MSRDETIQNILKEYDHKQSLYSAFTLKQEHLISELLRERSFSPHSVTSRVKSRQSLKHKIERTDKKYTSLLDVTDISGVRITTYFSDEVDKIAAYLKAEFEIIEAHSVDKRKMLDSDKFGYLSLHYVAKLSEERLKLTEYRRFPNLLCEIQIRSILQHAWAEIEHDLGYKTRVAVPQTLRRRFSRLAGLLELADQEFVTIRNELETYKEKLPEEIRVSPATVTLDKLSLTAFLKSNPTARALDDKIASFFGAKITESSTAEGDLRSLNFLGIHTISELDGVLTENRKRIEAFAKHWISSSREAWIGSGICLLYLWYVLIAQTGSAELALRFLHLSSIGPDPDNLVKKIFDTYTAIQEE